MCERCAELEERVAWLESELGYARDSAMIALLERAFGLTRGPAQTLAALFKADDKVLSQWVLAEASATVGHPGDRTPELATVYVHRIRNAMGFDTVETVRARGYRLSDTGRDRVREAVGPGREVRAA